MGIATRRGAVIAGGAGRRGRGRARRTGARGSGAGHGVRSRRSPTGRPRLTRPCLASKLSAGLSRLFRRVGSSGAFVIDAGTNGALLAEGAAAPGSSPRTRRSSRPRPRSAKFGPDRTAADHRLVRRRSRDSVSQGLYLRGGGDPTLTTAGLNKLADRVRAAGVTTVQGPLRYDASFLDSQTGIPEHGITSESVGRLSGLQIDNGSPSDPAKTAAQRFEDALRKDGVSIGEQRHTCGCRPRAPCGWPTSPLRRWPTSSRTRTSPPTTTSPRCCSRTSAAQFGDGVHGRRHRGGAAVRRQAGRQVHRRERLGPDPAQQGLTRPPSSSCSTR